MDLTTLAAAALVAVFALFLIVISRLSGDGPGIAELFKSTTELAWPRGIQEEEPVRWRVELLEASGPSVESAHPVGTAPATTPVAGRDGPTYADRRASYPVT